MSHPERRENHPNRKVDPREDTEGLDWSWNAETQDEMSRHFEKEHKPTKE